MKHFGARNGKTRVRMEVGCGGDAIGCLLYTTGKTELFISHNNFRRLEGK
jgi:hypothetical protein